MCLVVFFSMKSQTFCDFCYQVYPELDEALLTRVMGTAKLTIMEENSFSGERSLLRMIFLIKKGDKVDNFEDL